MAFQTLDAASLTALADNAARRIATDALTNVELREALLTSRTANGVRIGGCEITYTGDGDERLYAIRAGDNMDLVCDGITFYETARYIVMLLNSGLPVSHVQIRQIIATNGEYARARDMARFHSARFAHYDAVGDDFRASVNEDKLGRNLARLDMLRQRLLRAQYSYY